MKFVINDSNENSVTKNSNSGCHILHAEHFSHILEFSQNLFKLVIVVSI